MTHSLVHLTTAGVSLVLDCTGGRLPSVVHWGAALGELSTEDLQAIVTAGREPIVSNAVDEPIRVAILPEPHAGWSGKPGVSGHRDGEDWSPRFTTTSIDVIGEAHETRAHETRAHETRAHEAQAHETADSAAAPTRIDAGPATVVVEAADAHAQLAVRLEIELLPSGLVRTRAALTNTGTGTYTVDDLTVALPIPTRAREILDFAGRWGKERTPQRRELVVGIHEREGRKGRTGADAATVLSVGVPGFGFADGELWGVHAAWSGNHRHFAERLFNGKQVIGGGELLLPGEVRLGTGETYEGPWLHGAYANGLDEQARRFHRYLRSRPQHPRSVRPMTINVWEAVYFDHDLARLEDLADRSARLGVERFVLDDGWFRHRRNDFAGLGDWFVDEDVWPDGLSPLVDHVRAAGMQFGLWFEPEMINEDSDLARAHPEWIMQADGRLPVRSRHQQVLNLAIPEAYEYVLDRMTAIIDEYRIDYVKWDHNRDLVEAGYRDGGAAVHEQTLAAYRLMAALKDRFPGFEIESCSSGGSRVDLGVIEHTDRVWVSDCIDPLERQQMNRWTMQLLPAELLGSHIASGVNHTTGRWHDLSFRAGTALFGHLGIEWDLSKATAAEERDLAEWIALYKDTRALLHGGDLVRVDQVDDTLNVYGVVAPDRREAMFFLASLAAPEVSLRGRITFRDLDPDARYRVDPVLIGSGADGVRAPEWWSGARVFTGRVLASVGLEAPATYTERVVPFRLTAI